MPLHAQAQVIDIVDIVSCEFSHEEPAAWTRHQKPLLFQQPRGLANRRSADTQFPGDPCFHHFGAWQKLTLNNGLRQKPGDLADEIRLGESRQSDRRGHSAHQNRPFWSTFDPFHPLCNI